MSENSVIKVENLTKIYRLYDRPLDRLKESLHPLGRKFHREFYALHDVSFEVKKGEILGVIGKNGSGKSTLLKIITGVLTPTSGKVTVNGRISALLELGAGFNPELTGLENVYFSGMVMGYSREEMTARLDAILSFAEIGEFIHQPVKTYSSGMFVRLAFAVAINVEPEILIVDEALAVGDMQFQQKCLNKFYQLMGKGVTIIFVTHDTYSIRSLCNKALFLKGGTIVDHGEALRVVDNYINEIRQVQENEQNSLCRHEFFEIQNVKLINERGQKILEIKTGDEVWLEFSYKMINNYADNIVFVFNLYRNDNLYICGTTTLMDGFRPIKPKKQGSVRVKFSEICLLAGNYRFMVAINDSRGIGILSSSQDRYEFRVTDSFESDGIFNLKREWVF